MKTKTWKNVKENKKQVLLNQSTTKTKIHWFTFFLIKILKAQLLKLTVLYTKILNINKYDNA